jgi:GntR family transcriptional regulator
MAIKAQALHQQVADEMRRAIRRGRWMPGTQIPTEPELCATYGVSRPTVRLAVTTLRTEGLLDVQQGRGTFVRAPRTPADRTVIDHAATDDFAHWTDVETPGVTHVRIDETAAAALQMLPGEAAFLIERLLVHEPTGARARHEILLPMEHIVGSPLAQGPVARSTAQVFELLAAHHGPLAWHESVSARMPHPDERAALHAADVTPLLVCRRTTCTRDGHRPLALDTTTAPADVAEFAFRF